jgi:hypothetical protein
MSSLARTHRDAVLLALKANHDHGLPRTRADLRRIVSLALQDNELKSLGSRELAKTFGVSHNFICTEKKKLENAKPPTPPKPRGNGRSEPINLDEIKRASWEIGHRAGMAQMRERVLKRASEAFPDDNDN